MPSSSKGGPESEPQPNVAVLSATITASKDAIVVIGSKGSIILFNPAAEEMFGLKAREALGQSVGIVMPERYRQEHQAYVAGYLSTGISR